MNVKIGRHTNYWGEGLLFGAHAISYSQAPLDGAKAVTSPGIETKEVFLPIGQISVKAQATDNLTLAAGLHPYPVRRHLLRRGGPVFRRPGPLAGSPGFFL